MELLDWLNEYNPKDDITDAYTLGWYYFEEGAPYNENPFSGYTTVHGMRMYNMFQNGWNQAKYSTEHD